MTTTSPSGPYRRGLQTAVASWQAIAAGSPGAAVVHRPGVAVAVFPTGPERAVYNNAVLEVGLVAGARAAAVQAMESTYAAAGIGRFAAWVHERDTGMRTDLAARGYVVAESTRAMGADLHGAVPPPGRLDVALGGWPDHLRILAGEGLPPGLLAGVDPDAFTVVVGRLYGRVVACGLSFLREDDCGIFNVTTLAGARRRGLGSAVTAALLRDARDRGCRTAGLQSTGMGERVYAALGFRDLGRILEYAPRGAP